MTDYMFNFTIAEDAMGDIAAVNASVTSKLEDLARQVEPMLAEWTGAAREAYFTAKQEWTTQASMMPAELANARATLGAISDNYSSTENRAANIWRS